MLFFNDKTYEQFAIDQKNEEQKINRGRLQIVSHEDPYLFLVHFFSCLALNKIPLLLSAKLPELIQKEIQYEMDRALLNITFIEPVVIFLSSGTTGKKKGIIHLKSTLEKSAQKFINFFQARPSEKYYLNLPLNHVGGMMLALRAYYSQGHILTDLKNPIDYLSLVPLTYERMDKKILAEAKAILIGGAALKKEIRESHIYETYGMTETASFVTLNGVPMEGDQLKLDEDNRILIDSECLALGVVENGYYRLLERPYRTNDIGYKNSQSHICFLERADRVINSGGEKISLNEVERVIKEYIPAAIFYLIGVPDFKWGEKLVMITPDRTINQEELFLVLRKKLHPYALIKNIIVDPLLNIAGLKPAYEDLVAIYSRQLFSYTTTPSHHPLLFVFHGFMESSHDWEFLAKEFKHNFQVVLVDLPGHGKTRSDSFANTDDMFFKLKLFIQSFQRRDYHFLGYSMGGRVALQLSMTENPLSLILISTSMGLNSEEEKKQRLERDLALTIEDGKKFLDQWYEQELFGDYKKSSNYNNDMTSKLQHGVPYQWKQSLTLLSPGLFPTKNQNFKNLKIIPIQINGELDFKYNCKEAIILKKAYHNLHKTHSTDLIDLLKSLF